MTMEIIPAPLVTPVVLKVEQELVDDFGWFHGSKCG
jgi:hypothetical protein